MRWTDPETGSEYDVAGDEELTRNLQEIEEESRCEHPTTELVWTIVGNGSKQLRQQCLGCFELTNAPAMAHSRANKDTKFADFEARDRRRKSVSDRIMYAYRRCVQRGGDWWVWYGDYLKSTDWACRRGRVMARANGICEGCRDAMASQVHHLTYKHVGNEFLFELVAVCEECHERLHNDKKDIDDSEFCRADEKEFMNG